MIGLAKTREAVTTAAGKVATAASDTRQVVTVLGAMVVAALGLALIALCMAAAARRAAFRG